MLIDAFFFNFIEGIKKTTFIEWTAVLANIVYVVFITKEKSVGWLFGGLGAAIYVYLCYINQRYLESLLQMFYTLLAFIGYLTWMFKHKNKSSNTLSLSEWSFKKHMCSIALIIIAAYATAYFFELYTEQKNPYIDAITTFFSIFATYLVVQKIISNWIYWIVINLFCVYLYFEMNLILSAVLYLIMALLAYNGWKTWSQKNKNIF